MTEKAIKFLIAVLVLCAVGVVFAFAEILSSLRSAREQLAAEKTKTAKQIAALQQEVSLYKRALESVSPPSGSSRKHPDTTQALLLSDIHLRASCQDLGKKGNNQLELYDFNIWVDAPKETLSRIESVTYEFNHPTFKQKSYTVPRSVPGKAHPFQQDYIGWGCLDSVLVTPKFSDADAIGTPIDFNMCSALGNQGCSEH